jgi:hypothetical protein
VASFLSLFKGISDETFVFLTHLVQIATKFTKRAFNINKQSNPLRSLGTQAVGAWMLDFTIPIQRLVNFQKLIDILLLIKKKLI